MIPSAVEIDRVTEVAEPDTRDYLWTIREPMGTAGEINRLMWEDVDFEKRVVVP